MSARRNVALEVFESLEDKLPQDWIAKIDKDSDKIEIFGPNKATIYVKPNNKGKISVVGCWPPSECGKEMDPYEWGVLSFTDAYPFVRLFFQQSVELKVSSILNYLINYNSIYNDCLRKSPP